MHNKKNNIDKVDEALRILWLDAGENASESDACNQLAGILAEPVQTAMPAEEKEKLMADLFITMSTVSLGELIVENMQSMAISADKIAEEVKLSEERINQLKNDEIYPNSVPVVLLNDFLKKLKISFDLAEKGILKTFDVVRQRLHVPTVACRPVFRRTSLRDDHDISGSLRKTKTDLYENKEALFNYLAKLEELMTKE
ncbi:MAG: hypothetical protein WBP58_03005 [Chitinophagaceae bacterium]